MARPISSIFKELFIITSTRQDPGFWLSSRKVVDSAHVEIDESRSGSIPLRKVSRLNRIERSSTIVVCKRENYSRIIMKSSRALITLKQSALVSAESAVGLNSRRRAPLIARVRADQQVDPLFASSRRPRRVVRRMVRVKRGSPPLISPDVTMVS